MAIKILIDGPGAQLETATRATLGRRPESEELILPFVENQPPSSMSFMNVVAWPGNGSWGWTYPGPARRLSTSAA
jgi:hypothetical protein